MSKDISLKDIVEFYFNKGAPIATLTDLTTYKNYLNRTIQSYNVETGDFMISKCDRKFNVYAKDVMAKINSYDLTWNNFICQRLLGNNFKAIQERIENLICCRAKEITVNEVGGSWLKRTSNPKVFKVYLNNKKVEGIMTYGTVTDFRVDDWCCGQRYSVTSSKHARNEGYYGKNYQFVTEND